MDGYNGSIELIAGLTTKNGNTGYFLLNTEQIQATAEGKSLFDYLNELVIGGGTLTPEQIEQIEKISTLEAENEELKTRITELETNVKVYATLEELQLMLDDIFGTSTYVTGLDADGYVMTDADGYTIQFRE